MPIFIFLMLAILVYSLIWCIVTEESAVIRVVLGVLLFGFLLAASKEFTFVPIHLWLSI